MSARKRQTRAGRSQALKTGRAYRRLAAKAYRAGMQDKGDELLDRADYWTARHNCNRDKLSAVDGAVVRVSIDSQITAAI
jgi:hypothetical protein